MGGDAIQAERARGGGDAGGAPVWPVGQRWRRNAPVIPES
jgi:hypothetical protein